MCDYTEESQDAILDFLKNNQEAAEEKFDDIDLIWFKEEILKFPCYQDANPAMPEQELFELIAEAHKEDNLTEEQELAMEAILHLQDAEFPFNMNRAVEIWAREDFEAFINLATMVHQRPKIDA